MTFLRRLPALLALLLLGAHFLRIGYLTLVGISLLMMVPLFISRSWAQRLVQGVLLAGAVLWGLVLAQKVHLRLLFGEPWLRLLFILGAVALFTVWSAWLLRPRKVTA